jgi:hypothetical protein
VKTLYQPRCRALLSVIFDGRGGEDSKSLAITVIPKSASVELNGYNEADTWSLSFDARLLPFDPDIIRSMAVRIYMYGADNLDDQRRWATPEHEMIVGLADDAELDLRDGQTFNCNGRDYTALMLDPEWNPKDKVPYGIPLDQAVQKIVNDRVTAGGKQVLRVVFESDETPPIAGAALRRGGRRSVQPGKSVWDVIYDLCLRHGFLVFVRGEDIIITEPRIQNATSLARARRVAYGRNLRSLRASRKFAKERVPQVIVTGYDPKSGKVIEERYPAKSTAPTTAIGTDKDERKRYTLRGVTDRATLRRAARTRHENLARTEAEYSLETRHMEDLEGLDMLRLRAGDPIMIAFDAFNAEQMRQLSIEQRREHLISLGYSGQVAGFVAAHFDRLNQFRQPYYTESAKFDISDDDGLVVSADVGNYAFVPREEA